jgi:hypothetical protein
MRFRTKLLLAGKTATGFVVPPEVVEGLGAGKRPAVRVTINGFTYRNTIATMGEYYMLGVSAENRAGAGVVAGDELDVEIELDTQAREVTVPPELVEALAGDPAARKFFDGLSYSQKRWFADPIRDAKTAETRQRRIDKALTMLREGRSQR